MNSIALKKPIDVAFIDFTRFHTSGLSTDLRHTISKGSFFNGLFVYDWKTAKSSNGHIRICVDSNLERRGVHAK